MRIQLDLDYHATGSALLQRRVAYASVLGHTYKK